MGEEAQVEVSERAALCTRLQIVRQGAPIVVPVGLVLGVELHHPGVVVQLVEGILQGVLQRIARLPQPGHLAALGADRRQLEEGRHRLAVFQQQIGRAHAELQSLIRISYAVFCLKKKKNTKQKHSRSTIIHERTQINMTSTKNI